MTLTAAPRPSPVAAAVSLRLANAPDGRGADLLLHGADEYAHDEHDDQAVRGDGEFDQHPQVARDGNAGEERAVLHDQQPDEQGQCLAPHREGERTEQKHGDADRHVRAAELRPDGIGERNADKIGSDRERQRDEQSGRDIQYLIDFAPSVDLRRRGFAQQPWDDDRLADQVHERHAVQMPRAVAQAEQRRGRREQQGLQR